MGSAQTQGIHQPLRFILGHNYTHLNFKMEEPWMLDGIENIPKLFELGKQRAEEEFPMISGGFFSHQRKPFEPYEYADNGKTEIPLEYSAGNT